jgi:hypothetical protein
MSTGAYHKKDHLLYIKIENTESGLPLDGARLRFWSCREETLASRRLRAKADTWLKRTAERQPLFLDPMFAE